MPSETIFEIIGAPPLELILFFSLAVVWAPSARNSSSEAPSTGTSARGGACRWPRSRAATLFGFMHGYGPLFVFPLIALGTVFAMMREWAR